MLAEDLQQTFVGGAVRTKILVSYAALPEESLVA